LANALDAYVELFRRGRFFEAHEALEPLWLQRDGDPFLQGLIIFAAAYVKVERGGAAGARTHFARALRYLRAYRPEREGFDTAAMAAHAERCLEALAAGGPVPPFDMRRTPSPPPPPPAPASDEEILRVLAEVAAARRPGVRPLLDDVPEALLRLAGRAGARRVHRLYRSGRK
jgi:hypothetical protein